MTAWLFPGDTPLQKARRLLWAYRTHLKAANPQVCAALDEAATAYGETWVCEQPVTTPADQLLKTAEAADLAGVDVETIRAWRKRGVLDNGVRRRLTPDSYSDRGWPLFLAEQVLVFAAATRRTRLRRAAA